MTIIIFAGGAGTRLWPLSRVNSPKQFTAFKDHQSTLQMTVDRVRTFGMDQVYISTNEQYVEMVHRQVPELALDHVFAEPAKRDLAAAVGLTLMRLKKQGVEGTVAVVWADHFMEHPDRFSQAMREAEQLISQKKDRFIFLGEQPTFANHNLGWIRLGEQYQPNQYQFLEWKYRPDTAECQYMFDSKEWVWNTGYFVFDLDFVCDLYKQHMPIMYTALQEMVQDEQTIATAYPKLEVASFDSAIVEKIDPSQAVVLKVALGWSDPGTLYALKKAFVPSDEENFEHGLVVSEQTTDSLIYNEEEKKIVTVVGLDGMVVVNTKDALLVCPKEKVPEIKMLLKKLEEKKLQDYL